MNNNRKLELDVYQEALRKIKLHEATIPMQNGKIINDTDTYEKVEKLLACPEMEQSHQFLYDIDFDQLSDDIVKKVDDLYDLAIKQGLIEVEPEEELEATSTVTYDSDGITDVEDVAEIVPSVRNVINCYTCFYSAIKNGEIKTGECYSNAPTPEQAKVDAISKLTQIGFSDINIIAIETGDTDLANCDQLAHTVDSPKETKPTMNDGTLTETSTMFSEADDKEDTEKEVEVKTDVKDEPEEKEEEKEPVRKEPSHQEKVELFAKFFKTFKDLLIKMKTTSYKNFNIDGKADFWKRMSEIWNEDYDPRDFMTPANIEKLENFEVKIK